MKENNFYKETFFSTQNLSNLLIVLTILSFPFNYKIFLFLRPQDFFVLGFVLLNIKYIKTNEVRLILLIILFIILSCIIGYYNSENFYYHKLAFIYKIIIPILFIFLLKDFFNKKNYKNFYFLTNFIFCFYLLYVLFFYYFEITKLGISVPKLPSSISIFSSSSQNQLIDKHLMGNLVGLFFCINLVFQLENNNKLFVKIFNIFILYVFLLIFMKLFESRGIYLFFLVSIYLNVNYLFQRINSKIYKVIINYTLIFISIFFIVFIYKNDFINNWAFYDLKHFYKIYISENTLVGLHASRIISWYDYLPNDVFSLFFGIGATSYEQRFLDNGILFIILNLGLVPSILLTLFFVKNFKTKIKLPYSLKFLFYLVILSNLFISEFFLVSRYVFILVILYFLFEVKTQTLVSNTEKQKHT